MGSGWGNIIAKRIEQFPNFKNAFQVEGCDIMITEDLQPILIECNNKPGFSNKTAKTDDIQREFFNFIDRNLLAPVFGRKDSKDGKDGNDSKKDSKESYKPLFSKRL